MGFQNLFQYFKLMQLTCEEDSFASERPNIMELFKYLPLAEHLTTWDYVITLFDLDSVPQELSTSLIHLKHFCFEDMSFDNVFGMAFLAVLIKCSPNLEKIKLEIDTFDMIDVESVKLEEYSFIFEEVSKFWLEHLNKVGIKNYRNFKPVLEFVKFILARSPILKKVILLTYRVDKNDELEMLTILSHAPRASPVVILENHRLENDD
ncbi:putative FBD domain-containing protein [Helianthus annuus]|nr:putative FBD domain-containing protein [Helianthus annuus]